MRNIHDYSNIMNIPYPKSTRHKPMSIYDRAAQFAPFAALTGHKEMVEEKERIVDHRRVLDDSRIEAINQILNQLQRNDLVKVTYFIPDLKKTGGKYVTIVKNIKRIDEYSKCILFEDSSKILIEDLYEIEIVKEEE